MKFRFCLPDSGITLTSVKRALKNWSRRHRHPASRWLHAIGIPLLPLAGYLAVVQWIDGAWNLWWRPVGLAVISYLLQWIGHAVEGNDMGEVILVKKLLGRPFISESPRCVKQRPH